MILRGNVASDILKLDTSVSIVIPNNFNKFSSSAGINKEHGESFNKDKKYKVAYLLHGLFGDNESWIDNTMLNVYAGFYNTIFVMPNAMRSFYTDMAYGYDYLKYIGEELPQICENVFNISAGREDTAVIGGSMGGYGALKCALTYPDKFGYCAVMSAACLYLRENIKKDIYDEEFVKSFGKELINDFKLVFGSDYNISEHDEILDLAEKIKNKPIFYSVCGYNDIFFDINNKFADDMKKLGYNYTYENIEGKHDWFFFDKGLKKSLEFLYRNN